MKTQHQWRPGTGVLILLSVMLVGMAGAHCQIPCGIYGDQLRADLMQEHLVTITKSIQQINSLSVTENPNQVVRWVQNKELHADKLAHLITYYFMAQRIKYAPDASGPIQAQYVKQLTLLHRLLVATMKTKQGTDLNEVKQAEALLKEFRISYFGNAEHTH